MLRISQVFALMLAMTAVARAQPDKKTQALQLAAESERAYKDGKFEKSAELLRKAHGIYPEPLLLYNLGRALEGIGDAKGAVEAYEEYLRDAKQIDDRPAIERRIATLKAQLDKADKDKPDKPDKTDKDKADADAKAQQDEKDRLAREQADKDQAEKERLGKEQAAAQAEKERLDKLLADKDKQPPPPPPEAETHWGPWLALGAGGAIVVGGAVFGWRANVNHDDAVSAPKFTDASDLQDAAKSDATVANVMFVLGGAALIGGAVWEYLDWKSGGARVQLTPTGVAATWTWR